MIQVLDWVFWTSVIGVVGVTASGFVALFRKHRRLSEVLFRAQLVLFALVIVTLIVKTVLTGDAS